MSRLDDIVMEILDDMEPDFNASTFCNKKYRMNRFLKFAREKGFTEPTKALFDEFLADDHGSKIRRETHFNILRIIDLKAKTYFLTPDGDFYNNPMLPTEEEANAILDNLSFPVSTGISTSVLIVRVLSDLKRLDETKSTCGQYLHALRKLQAFIKSESGDIDYSEEICLNFLVENDKKLASGQIKEWKWKINRKAVTVLMEVAKNGHYQWSIISNRKANFSDESLETVHKNFIESLRSENYSIGTIELRDYVFRSFISFGGFHSSNDFKELSVDLVQSIVNKYSERCCISSLHTVLNIFKNILIWLHKNGYVDRNLSETVLKPFNQRGNIASYLTHEDEDKIIAYLENSPLRDKAMSLLAIKCGMRSSDICNLRFDEIDWKNDQIRLHQHKTGIPLILPLLAEVGNAIYDYICNERPKPSSPSPYIFLSKNAPFHKLEKITFLVNSTMKQTGVSPVNGDHKGCHLYRQTMVHRLLEKEVPHRVITEALGHTARNSDKNYITMEELMLRKCALNLDFIGKKSWEGKKNNE